LHEEVGEVDAFAGLDFDADEGVVAGGVGDLLPAGENLVGAGFEEVADVVEGFDAGFDEEAVVDVAEPAGLFVDALGVGGGGFDGVDEVEDEDVFVGTGAEAEGVGFVGAGFDEGGFVEEFEGLTNGAGVLVTAALLFLRTRATRTMTSTRTAVMARFMRASRSFMGER
jgi:hypothetical protein